MIDINRLIHLALPGDAILTGTYSKFSVGGLIQHGQRIQTPDGKPSKWKHILMYVDSMTIAESTIDFNPYIPTGKRMDNGPQYNDIRNLSHEDYACLLHFREISNIKRQIMLNTANEIIESGKYRYDITGLLGSLLTYWFMPWSKSNPLSAKKQLYCSAFLSKILHSIGIDPDEKYTDRNTSPERTWQWAKSQDTIDIYWL